MQTNCSMIQYGFHGWVQMRFVIKISKCLLSLLKMEKTWWSLMYGKDSITAERMQQLIIMATEAERRKHTANQETQKSVSILLPVSNGIWMIKVMPQDL